MECEDIINKKFNRSFIGYDIGQVDAFLDELYSEMQALKAELEMLRAARQTSGEAHSACAAGVAGKEGSAV